MTRNQVSSIALAFSALFAGHAMAADNGLVTRAQVKAELAEAIRTGNVIIGDSGELLRDVSPQNYPAQAPSTVTRAQVQAELAEAVRTGNVLVLGDTGQRLNEVYPEHYRAEQYVASKTREQVRAELAKAASNGTLYKDLEG